MLQLQEVLRANVDPLVPATPERCSAGISIVIIVEEHCKHTANAHFGRHRMCCNNKVLSGVLPHKVTGLLEGAVEGGHRQGRLMHLLQGGR